METFYAQKPFWIGIAFWPVKRQKQTSDPLAVLFPSVIKQSRVTVACFGHVKNIAVKIKSQESTLKFFGFGLDWWFWFYDSREWILGLTHAITEQQPQLSLDLR